MDVHDRPLAVDHSMMREARFCISDAFHSGVAGQRGFGDLDRQQHVGRNQHAFVRHQCP